MSKLIRMVVAVLAFGALIGVGTAQAGPPPPSGSNYGEITACENGGAPAQQVFLVNSGGYMNDTAPNVIPLDNTSDWQTVNLGYNNGCGTSSKTYDDPGYSNGTGDWPNSTSPWATLVNGTPDRVWIHGDNASWGECLNPDNVFELHTTSGHLSDPSKWQDIQITSTTTACSTESSLVTAQCVSSSPPYGEYDAPFVVIGKNNGQVNDCFQGAATYTGPYSGNDWVVSAWTGRVWFHQNTDGSGSSECFNHTAGFGVSGAWEDDPGNIQLSTTTSQCP